MVWCFSPAGMYSTSPALIGDLFAFDDLRRLAGNDHDDRLPGDGARWYGTCAARREKTEHSAQALGSHLRRQNLRPVRFIAIRILLLDVVLRT